MVFIWLFLTRNYWSSLDYDLMASIWEKTISILAGNLISGRSYLITAVTSDFSVWRSLRGRLIKVIRVHFLSISIIFLGPWFQYLISTFFRKYVWWLNWRAESKKSFFRAHLVLSSQKPQGFCTDRLNQISHLYHYQTKVYSSN